MVDSRSNAPYGRAAKREWIAACCLSVAASVLLGFLLLLAAQAQHSQALQATGQDPHVAGAGMTCVRSLMPGSVDWPHNPVQAYIGPRPPYPETLVRAGAILGSSPRQADSLVGLGLAAASPSRSPTLRPGSIALAVLVVLAWIASLALIAHPPRALWQVRTGGRSALSAGRAKHCTQ